MDKNALYVFQKLYFDEGETEPRQVFARMGKAIAKVREDFLPWLEKFVEMQEEGRFRLNSPAMMNLGCKRKQIASACFVGDLKDSMESIQAFYDDATKVFLAGSGIGVNFSDLREKDAPLSSGGSSSGPVAFIKHLDSLGGTIKSGGKCLAPEQLVWTMGGVKTVEELERGGKSFVTLSFDVEKGKLRATRALAFKSGRKQVMQLRTDCGCYQLSEDHPVMLVNGKYCQVKDLRKGDLLKTQIIEKIDNELIVKEGESFEKQNLVRLLWEMVTTEIPEDSWTAKKTWLIENGLTSFIDVAAENGNETFDGVQEVIEIKKLGLMPVYDVEIQCGELQGLRNFLIMPFGNKGLGSGIIVSNTRRAASMVMFDINHPDVLEIIKLKTIEKLSNLNISINLSDEFMKAVQNDEIWQLVGKKDGKIKARIPARTLLRKIAESAHACGDPGVAFLDRVNRFNTLPLHPIRSSNPCGEQFLIPYGSCNLGNINIAAHVQDGVLDWRKLADTTKVVTRALDAMLDACEFPTRKFAEVARKTRNIGVGIMGLADALLMLGLPYDSPEARELAGRMMESITKTAWQESAQMAAELGPFEWWDEAKDRLRELWGIEVPVRNAQVTTIPPSGSTSISCSCSSGMEPLFAIVYEKHISDTGDMLTFIHPEFQRRYKNEPWFNQKLLEEIKKFKGSLQKINDVPPEVKRLWKVAHDIHWLDRILMQSELQKYVTNSISSTVNLPKSATVETVEAIYQAAFEQGLKGVTVYRDGSLQAQPVQFGGVTPESRRISRPRRLYGFTDVIRTGEGNMYVTINEFNGVPIECFVEIGKSGGNKKAHAEALGRMVSLSLQLGASVQMVYDQLIGIAGKDTVWHNGKQVLSIYDGLSKVLWEEYLNPQKTDNDVATFDECPQCHGRYIHKEGCGECLDCGYSKCH